MLGREIFATDVARATRTSDNKKNNHSTKCDLSFNCADNRCQALGLLAVLGAAKEWYIY